MPDGATIEFGSNFSRAVIDNAGKVAVRGNVDFDGLFAGGASIFTPKGVVVFVGDLIGGAPG